MPSRRVLLALATSTALLMVALIGSGWYFSDVLWRDGLAVDHQRLPDIRVLQVQDRTVTLEATDANKATDLGKEGTFGLEWSGGYGRLGPIRKIAGREVSREFTPLIGAPGVGTAARLDGWAYPGDPAVAFGLPFQEVVYESPLGPLPAWRVAGGKTWAILVHGKNADRREALRTVPSIARVGLSSLTITYRNDERATASPEGIHRFGATEWEDLEGAAKFAVTNGADSLVLVGYSMGGAIVASFLSRSALADRVQGVILDSPVLNFGAAVEYGAARRRVPAPVTAVAQRLATLRFGVNWSALDYAGAGNGLRVPTLLFHGDADSQVPVAGSDAFAAAHPSLVTYLRTPGAEHVRSWNVDPLRYETAVTEFLRGLPRR